MVEVDGDFLADALCLHRYAVKHIGRGHSPLGVRDDYDAQLLETGRVRGIAAVPAGTRALFPTAHEISAAAHIRVQAAFQAHVDNAVSKTINFPAAATVAEIADACRRGFELGCKGMTVYRHGTKAGQVLTPIAARGECPDCLGVLEFGEGARLCRTCGFSSSA